MRTWRWAKNRNHSRHFSVGLFGLVAIVVMDSAVAMTLLDEQNDNVAPGATCTTLQYPIIARSDSIDAKYDKEAGVVPSLPQFMATHKDIGNTVGDGGMWAPYSDEILNVTACRLLADKYTRSDEEMIYDQFMPRPIAQACNSMVCIAGPCTMMEIDYQTYSPSGPDSMQTEVSMFGIPVCRSVFGRGTSNELAGNPNTQNAPVGDNQYYKTEADIPQYSWAPIDGTDDPALMEWREMPDIAGSQCALPDGTALTDLASIMAVDNSGGSAHVVHATGVEDAKEKCSPVDGADNDYPFMTIWSSDPLYTTATRANDRQKQPPQIMYLEHTDSNTTSFLECIAPITARPMFANAHTGDQIRLKLLTELQKLQDHNALKLTNNSEKNWLRLSAFVGGIGVYDEKPYPEFIDAFFSEVYSLADRADLKFAVQFLYTSCNEFLYTPPEWVSSFGNRVTSARSTYINNPPKNCFQFCMDMEYSLTGQTNLPSPSVNFLLFAWFLRYGGIHGEVQSDILDNNLINAAADSTAVSGYGIYQAKLDPGGNFQCAPNATVMGLTYNTFIADTEDEVTLLGRLYSVWEQNFDSGFQPDLDNVLADIRGKVTAMAIDKTNTTLVKMATTVTDKLWRYLAVRYAVCTPTQMIPPSMAFLGQSIPDKPYSYLEANPLWMPGTFDRVDCCEPITVYTRGILNSGATDFFKGRAEQLYTDDGFASLNYVKWGFDPGEHYLTDQNLIITPPKTGTTAYQFICWLSENCNPVTSPVNKIPLDYAPQVFRRDNALAKSRDRLKAGNLPLFPLGQSTTLDPEIERCPSAISDDDVMVNTKLFGRHVIQGDANLEFNAVACSVWGYCDTKLKSTWQPWDSVSVNAPFANNDSIAMFQACCRCVTSNYIVTNTDPLALYASGADYPLTKRNTATHDNSKVPLWNTDNNELLAPCSLPVEHEPFCTQVKSANDSTPLSHHFNWSGCIMTWTHLQTHGQSPCHKKEPDWTQDTALDKNLINLFRRGANGDNGLKQDNEMALPLRGGRDHGSMSTKRVQNGLKRMQRAIMLQFGTDDDKYPGRSVFVVGGNAEVPDTGPQSDKDVFWTLENNKQTAPDPSDPCLQRTGPATVSFQCQSEDNQPNIYTCKVHLSTVWDQRMPEPVGCTDVTYSADYKHKTLKQPEGGGFPSQKQPYDWDRCVVPELPEVGFKPQNPCRRTDEMASDTANRFGTYCQLNNGTFDWLDGSQTSTCKGFQHCYGPYCPTFNQYDAENVNPCGPTSCGRLGFTQFHRGDSRCYSLFTGDPDCNTFSEIAGGQLQCEAWDPTDLFRWCTDDTMHRPELRSDSIYLRDGWNDGTGDLHAYDQSTPRKGNPNGAIYADCCTSGYAINPLKQDPNSWPRGKVSLSHVDVGNQVPGDSDSEKSSGLYDYLCTAEDTDGVARPSIRNIANRVWADDFVRGINHLKLFDKDHSLGDLKQFPENSGTDYEMSGQSQVVYDQTNGMGTCSEFTPTLKTLNDGLGSLAHTPINWGEFLKPAGGSGQVQYVIDAVEWTSYESVSANNRQSLKNGDIDETFASSTKYNMPGVAPFVQDARLGSTPVTPAGTNNQSTFYSNTIGKDSSYSCDCGRASPVYACAKNTAQDLYDRNWFGTFPFKSTVANAVVDYMMCGWTWDTPPSAGPFFVGLYIPSGPGASSLTTIERDPLGSTNKGEADADLNRFFLDVGAPNEQRLRTLINNLSDTGNDFGIKPGGTSTVTPRVKMVKYPGSCIRWPYGRIHRSMLADAASDYFAFETGNQRNGGLSAAGDEALYGYCEQTGPDNEFVFCNHDKMSLEDRRAWCTVHDEANSVSVGAVMGSRDINDACANNVCVFIPGDSQWSSPETLWRTYGKPDTTVVVAPFSTAVAFGMQAGVAVPSIVKQIQNRPKVSVAEQMKNHKFDAPIQGTIPDSILAVNMTDLLAVASLRALAAQPTNITVNTDTIVERLTRLYAAALQFNENANVRAAGASNKCASGYYTPMIGEFLAGDDHWENYACGVLSDFEPRVPAMQHITLPGSTLVSGAPNAPLVADTTATQCNAFTVSAPRFTVTGGITVPAADTCTLTGLSAVPVVFAPGDNRNTTLQLTVISPKTAAMAVVGYDLTVPKPSDAVANMDGSEFDITVTDPPADYLGHIAAAIVHATGDIRISCAEKCTVVIQDVAATITAKIESNWAVTTLDVTDVTQVFGTAYEQQYFTQPPQHNTLLAVTAATLGLTTIGLLVTGAFARATPKPSTTTANDGANKAGRSVESLKEKANS